jgi:hypothetical protein
MVVVVGEPGVVVVVVTPAQLPAAQLSQQLGAVPAHADPPLGAVHFAALRLVAHLVLPFALVRQQMTEPAAPQVDFLAHDTTAALHCLGRLRLFAAVFATRATHWT